MPAGAHERVRPLNLIVLLRRSFAGRLASSILLIALCCGISQGEAPSTAPAGGLDQATQDVLREIEGSSPRPAATRPATQSTAASAIRASDAKADHEQDSPPQWLGLLVLFAPALITAAAVAVACGVVGVFVLLRREALLALAMPQVVAAGAAVGMRVGWPTLPPALLAAVVALVYLVASKRRGVASVALPALHIAGLSLSFLIIANHGQDVADLQNLFTGIDVAVSPAQAAIASPIVLAVGISCAVLWRRWLLLAQAPAAAELAGLSPARWDVLFLSLLVAVLLLGTDALGVVMVLALLFLPAATILPWTVRIPAALICSVVLGLVFLATGFWLSNVMSWPLSQSVGGVGFAAMALSHLLAWLLK